jgi:L-threonylcarbamoyladenylate synthase
MAKIGVDIEEATKLLKEGKLVSIPTETVYGLAANALDPIAVAQIFALKQRPAFDPLIIHLASADTISTYVQSLGPYFQKLYDAFSPGPITYVLPKKSIIPEIVTAGHSTVALRFPSHSLCRNLLQKLPFPLAAPSANLFGRVSPTNAQHVAQQFQKDLPYILDGGDASVGLESTIIDLSGKEPIILRLGGLSLEEIEMVLNRKVQVTSSSSSNPKAPGMLSAHYSPGIPLKFGGLEENLAKYKHKTCGTISFSRKVRGIPEAHQRILSPKGDLKEAASTLFSALRSFKQGEIDLILAEKFPEIGLGRAINDRLKRASVA